MIATNVTLSMLLHPNLAFDRVDSPQGLSRVVKGNNHNYLLCDNIKILHFIIEVGNATGEMNLSFEFGVRPRGKDKPASFFPFQTQIKFTRLDGTQVLRVVSLFTYLIY